MNPSDENGKPGRKPVLDDAERREICAILGIGETRRMAAQYVGSSVDTVVRTALRSPPQQTVPAKVVKRKMGAQET